MNIPRPLATLLLEPRSSGANNQRHELILNIVLLSLLTLSGLLLISYAINFLTDKSGYGSELIVAVGGASLLLIVALISNRKGYQRFIAAWVLAALFIMTSYSVLTWGVLLPQAMLTFALIVVIAGIVINGQASLYITLAISIMLFMINSYESNGVITYNTGWMQASGSYWNIAIYCVTLLSIATISWYSNRQGEIMLQRSIKVEHELTEERSLLEAKVADRTSALKAAQIEKLIELHRFAEFGKLTSTLLHDVANPLTSVGLELEQMRGSQTSGSVERAIEGLGYIEQYVTAARKQLRSESVIRVFNLADEIRIVASMSQLKAARFKVAIETVLDDSISLYGDPVRFNQISANLIANAIDAYEGCSSKAPYLIEILLRQTSDNIELCVCDHGIGIDQASVSQVFEPFYTTKNSQRGTGIGLSITYQAVVQAFSGTISVVSNSQLGTVFTVIFPLSKVSSENKQHTVAHT